MKAKAVQKKPASGSKGTNNTDQPEEVKKKQEDLREKTEKWKQGLGEEGLSGALSFHLSNKSNLKSQFNTK